MVEDVAVRLTASDYTITSDEFLDHLFTIT